MINLDVKITGTSKMEKKLVAFHAMKEAGIEIPVNLLTELGIESEKETPEEIEVIDILKEYKGACKINTKEIPTIVYGTGNSSELTLDIDLGELPHGIDNLQIKVSVEPKG